MMIDFTNMPKKHKAYAGANGSKLSIVYNEEQYMLKFPAAPTKNAQMRYSNSCVCEHLCCQIFKLIGIPVQETLLGTYQVNEKEKVVVACKDFTSVGIVLQDFASLKNQIIDSERNGYGTELEDILETFENQTAIGKAEISERFWDMFIIDAFIGNWDRHNGNWGFLYDTQKDTVALAPVFDCGSSLYPQADEAMMKSILEDKNEINYRIFEVPTSAIRKGGKRINYFQFLSSLENAECNEALNRIVPKINMSKIKSLIDHTPYIGATEKTFYKFMLSQRRDRILDYSVQLLQQK